MDSVRRLEWERQEEVLQLRRMIALLVIKAGGYAEVPTVDLITMERDTEVAMGITNDGNYWFRVQRPKA